MPISRARKEETVALLTERFEACQAAVFVDYRGLTVKELQELRKQLRDAGCHFHVAMNNLVKLALANCGMSTVDADGNDHTDALLTGPTAVAFGYDQPNQAAAILLEAAEKLEELQFKGGFFGVLPVVGIDGVKRIARMRSKLDVLADVVRIISPATALRRVVTVAKGAPTRIITVAKGAPGKIMALKYVLESNESSDAA